MPAYAGSAKRADRASIPNPVEVRRSISRREKAGMERRQRAG